MRRIRCTPRRASSTEPITQACGLPTTVAGLACGDYAVNTVQPPYQPTSAFGAKMPLVDDTTTPLTIGDRLTDAHVSWAWYSGGWDNANGNIERPRLDERQPARPAPIPNSVPAASTPPATAGSRTARICRSRPTTSRSTTTPGTRRVSPIGRTCRTNRTSSHAAQKGKLPAVSFVKPLGNENEHPGYASEPNGSDHLVDLIKAIESGPQAKNTLIIVTYDEFGGQWDHVSPPGTGSTTAPTTSSAPARASRRW